MTAPRARVASVNVNPAGGVPKHAVASARLTAEGVTGDRQRDPRHHGGPRRAVSLYSVERIEALQAEGHTIEPGSAGENLTLEGLDWDALDVGTRLRIGDTARLEITSYAAPCSNLLPFFVDGRVRRVSQAVHPGWSRLYARVLVEGVVRPGDPVEVEAPTVGVAESAAG